MSSNISSPKSHCTACRHADVQQIIQDVIRELTQRAENNILLREPLATLEKMMSEADQAETTCPSLSSTWVEHTYTYMERANATEFTSVLQKLIGLALCFSPRVLVHDTNRAITLIRLRHDAAMEALADLRRPQ